MLLLVGGMLGMLLGGGAIPGMLLLGGGAMPGMFPPPPNAVAFTYPAQGYPHHYGAGDFSQFQEMSTIYPSPPHMQGEFTAEFSDYNNLPADCSFPSPPISDCSSPDYHLELQC